MLCKTEIALHAVFHMERFIEHIKTDSHIFYFYFVMLSDSQKQPELMRALSDLSG